jgi:hypothetical protein
MEQNHSPTLSKLSIFNWICCQHCTSRQWARPDHDQRMVVLKLWRWSGLYRNQKGIPLKYLQEQVTVKTLHLKSKTWIIACQFVIYRLSFLLIIFQLNGWYLSVIWDNELESNVHVLPVILLSGSFFLVHTYVEYSVRVCLNI